MPEIRVGLQSFVDDKLPDDGTLVPKHVGFGN